MCVRPSIYVAVLTITFASTAARGEVTFISQTRSVQAEYVLTDASGTTTEGSTASAPDFALFDESVSYPILGASGVSASQTSSLGVSHVSVVGAAYVNGPWPFSPIQLTMLADSSFTLAFEVDTPSRFFLDSYISGGTDMGGAPLPFPDPDVYVELSGPGGMISSFTLQEAILATTDGFYMMDANASEHDDGLLMPGQYTLTAGSHIEGWGGPADPAFPEGGSWSTSSGYSYSATLSMCPEPLPLETKLLASDGAANDELGRSVAISGNTAVIGARWDDDNGPASGSAYVFRFNGSTWNQEGKLLASDGAADDNLGSSVAISGNATLIGSFGSGDNGANSGSAYVFRFNGSTSNQEAKLLASDGAASDVFGWSVAISGDTAVIGAPQDDDNGSNSGSAYVFRFNGSTWNQEAKLVPFDGAPHDGFGGHLTLSGDTAIIGAPFDDDNGIDSGSVYVFRFDGSVWNQEAKLLASDGAAGDFFGGSVAISGDTAVIGASEDGFHVGSAYVFRFNGLKWNQEAKLLASDGAADDIFGVSVAISGHTVVIGVPGDSDNGLGSGSAHVFRFNGLTWNQEAKLLASDGAASDRFGFSVALSGDTAVIGAVGGGSGSAYVFQLGSNGCVRLSEDFSAYAVGANPANWLDTGAGNSLLEVDNFQVFDAGGVITEIIDATGDGAGNALSGSEGIAVDDAGNVYVTGLSSNRAFKITPAGVITEIIDAAGDGAGNALSGSAGIAVDTAGNVYVTGLHGNNAFKITPAGVVTEIIDSTGDGAGNALSGSTGIAVDDAGNVYVTGEFSHNTFKITPAGVITEIIDAAGDGAGNGLFKPQGIAVDTAGNVYVTGMHSDNAFKITPAGVITEIIDAAGDGAGNGLNSPTGIAVDAAGNVYVTGYVSGNAFRITPSAPTFGTTSTATNIHSHYVTPDSPTWGDYEYTGRMMVTDASGGIGLTVLSDYPNSDTYYRLRRYGGGTFHINPHGVSMSGGTTDTGVVPAPNIWYQFKIEVQDTGSQTELRAKVWQEGTIEPAAWQIDSFDANANRLSTGTVGLWSMGPGRKYWDDLVVRSLCGPAGACELDSECDDGLFCNGVEICFGGCCRATTPPICDDGVACTVDSCDAITDLCEYGADDALCDNGFFCDGTEWCDPASGCQPGGDPCPIGGCCDEATDTCSLGFACASSIVFVDADAPVGGDGCGWTTAFRTLQEGLNVARCSDTVTQVWVAAGTYKPDFDPVTDIHTGDRAATFQLLSGVAVRGGFVGTEDPVTFDLATRDFNLNETILSGDLLGNDLPGFVNNAENSYHVVTGSGTDATATLDGFTVTGGFANGPAPDNHGAGVLIVSGSPRLNNCVITFNRTGNGILPWVGDGSPHGGDGAGLYCELGSPVLSACTITFNTTGVGGLLDFVWTGGNGGNGAGVFARESTLTLLGCKINSNDTGHGGNSGGGANGGNGGHGGGISAVDNTILTLTGCIIEGNGTGFGGGGLDGDGGKGGDGGGVYCSSSQATINGSTITGNATGSGGWGDGGVGGSGGNGAGVFCTAATEIANCTVVENVTGPGGAHNADRGGADGPQGRGGGVFAETAASLANTILFLNQDVDGLVESSQLFGPATIDYSCVQGWTGALGGVGNFGDDPLLDLDKIHLLDGSPCINAGDPAFIPEPGETDIDGEDRVQQCRVDIGADETPYFRDCQPNGSADACDIDGAAADDCIDAQPVRPGGTYTGTTIGATNDGIASCGWSDSSADMWYSYTPATDGTVTVSLAGSTYDTVLSIHTGCPGNTTNEEVCNDDYWELQSQVTFLVTSGTEYLIRIAGYEGNTGAFTMTLAGPEGSGISADCNGNGIPDECGDIGALLFVDADAVGVGDGTSWFDAFNNLQEALSVVGCSGAVTEVWVAAGTYKPDYDPVTGVNTGDRAATFQLLSGVAVRGGFVGTEDPVTFDLATRDFVTNETIMSGDLLGDDLPDFANNGENSYHVVTGSGTDATATLDGFTITGGFANGPAPDNRGAGVLIVSGSPALNNCVITANRTGDGITTSVDDGSQHGGDGAGLYCESGSPVLADCTLISNATGLGAPSPGTTFGGRGGNGAGAYFVFSSAILSDCTFANNTCGVGTKWLGGDGGGGAGIYGRQSTLTLLGCDIIDNYAGNGGSSTPDVWGGRGGHGGGICAVEATILTLSDCNIGGNTTGHGGMGLSMPAGDGGGGGGLYCASSEATIFNSTITGNVTGDGGSADYGNPAGDGGPGGGVFADPSATLTLSDCTVADNATGRGGDGADDGSCADGGLGGGVSLSTGTIQGCALTGNTTGIGGLQWPNPPYTAGAGCTGGHGAGIHVAHPGMVTIRSSIVNWNTTGAGGGGPIGFAVDGGDGGDGAGILAVSTTEITNCTVLGNEAGPGGAGTEGGSDGAQGRGGGVFVETAASLANTILFFNQDVDGFAESSQLSGPATIDYSCVQGWTGALGGVGNFGDDPMFVDADGPDNIPGTPDDDLHLLPASPAINTGDPAFIPEPGETDIDGEDRVQQCRVDIGADETPYFRDCQPNGIADACDTDGAAADHCIDAQPVRPGGTYTGTTVAATDDGNTSCCCSSGADMWYSYSPATDGWTTVSLAGSEYDTMLSIHTGCPGNATNEEVCNDDYWDVQSQVTFLVTSSTEYFIRVAGYYADTGAFMMTLAGPDVLGVSVDCNGNGIPDECEIADDPFLDCDGDGVFSECELNPAERDCDLNGVCDGIDITECPSEDPSCADCNGNGIPDRCDLDTGEVIIEFIDSTGDGAGNYLDYPADIAVDTAGNIYVTGFGSDNVFRITPTGVVTEIIDAAGDGLGNGLSGPQGIAVDAAGNAYVVGFFSGNAFKITPAGVIAEIIDGGGNWADVAVDTAGNVFVTRHSSVLRITPDGVITEIIDATGDGAGNILTNPYGIAVDAAGNVYVTGNMSHNAFRITPAGVITEIIDAMGDGAGNGPFFYDGIAVDGAGNAYVTGLSPYSVVNAFKITPAGVITEIIDTTGDGAGNGLSHAQGIAVDAAGNVYVTGNMSHNAFKITPAGVITEIIDATGDAASNGLTHPRGIAVDSANNVYVTGTLSDNAFKITPALDCNSNGIPDECELDADGDGTIDDCDGCPNDPLKFNPGVCGCSDAPADCGDGNPCTGDSCVEGVGCLNNGTGITDPCDDENPCTTGDVCQGDAAGTCAGTDTSAVDCNDADACTIDTCDPASGCVNAPITCNDGDECTTDTCDSATGCVYTPIEPAVDCDDTDACTTDTCDPATGCVNTAIDPLVDCNDDDLCTEDTCDPAIGCVNTPIPSCGADVRILPVVQLVDPATTPDTSISAPPTSVATVTGNAVYWIEIWASDVGTTNTGLTSVYVDVSFCGDTIPVDMSHGSIFTTFESGLIDIAAGIVDEFGGSALPHGGGIEPEWVRVGWIQMQAGEPMSACQIALRPSTTGVAAFGRDLVSWTDVELGTVFVSTGGPPIDVNYDLNGNNFIGAGDLSLFGGSWEQVVPPANVAHDFDCDLFVGVGDLSWFATGWQKTPGDPTILYPPPCGSVAASARQATDVRFSLVARSVPSATDMSARRPTGTLEAVRTKETFYVEVWATDVGLANSGLTSAYVNLNLPSDVVIVRDFFHGGVFTEFAAGSAGRGVIAGLGGSALPSGGGIDPQWVRVAIVELLARKPARSMTFELTPSDIGVAAYGRGIVFWDEIALDSITIEGPHSTRRVIRRRP